MCRQAGAKLKTGIVDVQGAIYNPVRPLVGAGTCRRVVHKVLPRQNILRQQRLPLIGPANADNALTPSA